MPAPLSALDPEANPYCLDPSNFRSGNRIAILRDGSEAFPRMIEAIRGARHSVLVEMYIVSDDEVGGEFAAALIDRARAGVPARLVFDSIGCLETPDEYFDRLRRGGVEVLEYHPVRWWAPLRIRLRRRNHRKLVVVDGVKAFVGSLNIWKRGGKAGPEWRDTVAEVQGPVVRDLVRLFFETWCTETGEVPLPEPPPESPPYEDGVAAAALGSERWRSRRSVGRAYWNALNRARSRIWISNAYFVPAGRYVRALVRAAARGVDVRILVPALTDIRAVYHASRAYFGGLLKAGVRIFELQGRIFHAKTAVVDGLWSAVGSYNLDHLSLRHNLEATLIALDRSTAAQLTALAEQDVAASTEVTREAWAARGWVPVLMQSRGNHPLWPWQPPVQAIRGRHSPRQAHWPAPAACPWIAGK